MKKKTRDSNYELLRIVSMFMIVIYHIIIHGYLLTNTTNVVNLILRFMLTILIVHVDSFILVSGYYQCKSDFKFKKIVSLNNAVWFYRVVILLLFIVFNIATATKVEIIRSIIPIDLGFYWFMDLYLILYCISPFLNILIKKIDKSTFQKLLFCCFIIISLLPTLTKQQAFYNTSGYSLPTFIFLYFIGAYIRLYGIEMWEYFKVNSEKFKRLIYFCLFCLLFLNNFALYNLGDKLLGLGNIAHAIGSVIINTTYAYDNPVVIMGAIAYFLWFGCLNIKSNFINKIGSLVFGVYLIHDNPYVRGYIYKLFYFPDSIMIVPKILLVAVIIFVSCLIIEWIRQLIFKLISHLKITALIRNRWYKYLDDLKSET